MAVNKLTEEKRKEIREELKSMLGDPITPKEISEFNSTYHKCLKLYKQSGKMPKDMTEQFEQNLENTPDQLTYYEKCELYMKRLAEYKIKTVITSQIFPDNKFGFAINAINSQNQMMQKPILAFDLLQGLELLEKICHDSGMMRDKNKPLIFSAQGGVLN